MLGVPEVFFSKSDLDLRNRSARRALAPQLTERATFEIAGSPSMGHLQGKSYSFPSNHGPWQGSRTSARLFSLSVLLYAWHRSVAIAGAKTSQWAKG